MEELEKLPMRPTPNRGPQNFRRKAYEFMQAALSVDPSRADDAEDEDVHIAAARGQRAEIERVLRESGDFALERRNAAGKSPLIIAVEN